MHIKIVSHNTEKSQSSSNIMQYLEKENEKKKIKNQHLILDGKGNEVDPNSVEYFFNEDYNPLDILDPNSFINVFEASEKLDNNRGTQNLKSSNFYMLNLSPSQKELEHMEKIAIEELNNRGLVLNDVEENSTAVEFFNEQKDQLMKVQLKLFTTDVMDEYARLMDREIYANQEALPSDDERKKMKPVIDEKFNSFLLEKGLDLNKPKFKEPCPTIHQFKIKQEYNHGKLFTVYSFTLEKNIDLFVPEDKYRIDGDKLKIEEEYYNDKYYAIIDKENAKREQVEVGGSSLVSNDYFTDYLKEDKILISYNWDKMDKDIKLYFNKSDVYIKGGICYIPESIYNDKIYEVKSQFLAKEFSDLKKDYVNKILTEQGFDISKSINDKGEEFYNYPDKVPSKEEFKKINIKASVSFNNYLVAKGYLPEKSKFSINNWNSRTGIDCKILAESEKAKLLLIDDERLKEPIQMWAGNFTFCDKSTGEVIVDENGKIQMLTDFYEYKISEVLKVENDNKVEVSDYKEIESETEKFIKNKESMQFTFENTGLKEPVSFNVQYEDLFISPNGNYTMEKDQFEHKLEKHIIKQAEKEFTTDFEKIKSDVNKEMLETKDFLKNKEIEKRFKNFLVDRNILQQESKTEDHFIKASIVETKKNSTMIAYKEEGRAEEVRLWVNNKIISKSSEEGIYFKNEKEITSIIDKALERDKERKEIVKIEFSKVETEEKTHKEENYTNYVFYSEVKGLEEPIKFTIKEEDLKKEGKEFFIEKYKLDNKYDNALKSAITKEYGNVKEDMKNEVWKENGFDTTKRKITGKDLMYYAKIETERKYTHTDKAVIKNKPIIAQIKEYEQSRNPFDKMKIGDLEKELIRDKYTGEVINEGVKKGGLNYHSHIVVSRHDKTSLNPKDKVSMSPNANHKDGHNNNGAKIGFNRDEFAKNIEKIFDEKFEYERPEQEKYAHLNHKKKELHEQIAGRVKGMAKGELKKQIMNHTGMNIVKNELNPVQKIKGELMPVPLPTSFPKGKLDLVIKVVKMAKNIVVDKGIHY